MQSAAQTELATRASRVLLVTECELWAEDLAKQPEDCSDGVIEACASTTYEGEEQTAHWVLTTPQDQQVSLQSRAQRH